MLYLRMGIEAGNDREFSFPLAVARRHGFTEMTFRRHVSDLIAAGFISKSSGWTTREPNRYRFEFGWKEAAQPP